MASDDPRTRDAELERRLKAQQGRKAANEEQGSAARAVQDDAADADRDPEEEGSAGRPQR